MSLAVAETWNEMSFKVPYNATQTDSAVTPFQQIPPVTVAVHFNALQDLDSCGDNLLNASTMGFFCILAVGWR